jgi:hypothetical protein
MLSMLAKSFLQLCYVHSGFMSFALHCTTVYSPCTDLAGHGTATFSPSNLHGGHASSLPPSIKLHCLEAVLVGVTEENCWPATLTLRILYSCMWHPFRLFAVSWVRACLCSGHVRGMWVPNKTDCITSTKLQRGHCLPTAHAVQAQQYDPSSRHTMLVKFCHELVHSTRLQTHAEVPVPSSMLGALSKLVWVGQLHQVDHFRPNVKPCPSVWQLVMWPMAIYIQACIQNDGFHSVALQTPHPELHLGAVQHEFLHWNVRRISCRWRECGSG